MHPSSKLYINLTDTLFSNTGLFQNEEDDGDSGTDYFNPDMAGTRLQRAERREMPPFLTPFRQMNCFITRDSKPIKTTR